MTPTLPIPTDNIYKFACLFGLTLLIVSLFSFVSVYSFSLDSTIKYSAVTIQLEAKNDRNRAEEDLLLLNKKLIEIVRSNRRTAELFIAIGIGLGIAMTLFGAKNWLQKIQSRDDRLAALQLEKLEIEVMALKDQAQQRRGKVDAIQSSPELKESNGGCG